MSRTMLLALASVVMLIAAACSGGAATNAPAASAPAASAPAASESGGSEAACAPSTETGTVTGAMANTAFDPAAITASVGDTVTWTNNDTLPHTATVESDQTCTTEQLAGGASGGIVFNTAGTYAFFCKVHPSMKGTVTVS